MQSAGVPLEEKARVAPGTTRGVAETALCIEMECDVLSIEGAGRSGRRGFERAGLARHPAWKVSEGKSIMGTNIFARCGRRRGRGETHALISLSGATT